MRNITKIVLLLVAAFVAYLLWPRSADLKAFDPAKLASLQAQVWEADRKGDGLGALWARFRIYTTQYGMAPVAALRIAQTQSSGLNALKTSVTTGSADSENDALTALTEKYALIKAQLKGADFDPDGLAREEFFWRTLVVQAAAPDAIATPLGKILAASYGGDPAHFTEVAQNVAVAQLQCLGLAPEDPALPPRDRLREAYQLLKEIAQTPPTTPAS